MSDMLKRYDESSKPRPAQARQIPGLAVNFVDLNNEFQNGFTTFHGRGAPTVFTDKALNHYDEEVRQVVVPDGFSPVEQGAEFNRWGPTKKYYNPGQPQNG